MHYDPNLPEVFCWTRFGTEAGEPIAAIIERKERERRSNEGVFFWGVGNSVAPGVLELVRQVSSPEVLFSPIKSPPRAVDMRPSSVVSWRAGLTSDGERFELPQAARVTSRRSKAPHYALVCATETPLRLRDLGTLHFGSLQNLASGNPLGASQVTAVVKQTADRAGGSEYVVALRARLVEPYFLRLDDPQLVQPAAAEPRAA